MGSHHWPLFGLRVRTPRLELRYVDDDLAHALADLAVDGIHDPDTMPFSVPWTRQGAAVLPREVVRHHWQTRATTSPDDWSLNFAVIVDGSVVGAQGAHAKAFPVARTFETGSWLGQRHQRQGIGKEMRQAILHLGFAGLGAEVAETGCWVDNAASEAVTRALGYDDNGWHLGDREGAPTQMLRFLMTRARWEARRRDDITIDGLEAALSFLGLDS